MSMLHILLLAFLGYFLVLYLVSRCVGRDSNDQFFRAGRRSPWPLVAFGMVGASISGVTFVGVPGWIESTDMTYMQMCLGFIVGYAVVAFGLLPLYYKLGLTSIYTYLQRRFGQRSYRVGAWFFLLSKLLGAAAKFYVVVRILQMLLFGSGDTSGTPDATFFLTALLSLLFIWLYTRRGGVRTLVWTDALQTLTLLVALVCIIWRVCSMLELDLAGAVQTVWNDPHSRMFEFRDFSSPQLFWKQFLSGVFVVIVMTGLDQDMMQKNLTCKNLRAAQKDMCSYGLLFAPVNFLFLSLGVLLLALYQKLGLAVPASGDSLLSEIVVSGTLGRMALVCFGLGVVSSAFSSADSALTALTTTFCVDILERPADERKRKRVHLAMILAFLVFTILFNAIGSTSVMNLIYTLVSYTYGPLLGLFAFGLLTRRSPREQAVPWIAIASPLLCLAIDYAAQHFAAYHFGYEMLLFNGALTFAGLYLSSLRGRGE